MFDFVILNLLNIQTYKVLSGKGMKILVITNPMAGGGKTLHLLPCIRKWLPESPREFSFSTPRSINDRLS